MFAHFGWKAVARHRDRERDLLRRLSAASSRRCADPAPRTTSPTTGAIAPIRCRDRSSACICSSSPGRFSPRITRRSLSADFSSSSPSPTATEHHQNPISLKPALLVGFFLAGLVVHGGFQGWWIAPVLASMTEVPLMFGAMTLTAFNDNAAITYLASLVPNFSDALKYAVVAGAVAGGGLTVIANAPNPAGQSILGCYFNGRRLRALAFARRADSDRRDDGGVPVSSVDRSGVRRCARSDWRRARRARPSAGRRRVDRRP